MSKPTLKELEGIFDDLKKYYDARDYEGAKLYIIDLHSTTKDINRLRMVLLISKSFKNHEVLKDVLQETVRLIEEQGIRVV